MTKTFKKAVSILLAVMMILSVFTIVPMSANAAPPGDNTGGIGTDIGTGTGASTWTFKLNSNFSGSWVLEDFDLSGTELTLAEGDYQFQIVAYVDGNLNKYRGNVQSGPHTDTLTEIMYDDGGNTSFHATGGHYVLSFDAENSTATITHPDHTWDYDNPVWGTPTGDWSGATVPVTLSCTKCDATKTVTANSRIVNESPVTCGDDGFDSAIFDVTVDGHQLVSDTLNWNIVPATGDHYELVDPEHHAEVPATYNSTGTGEYWECYTCGKLFSDADCTQEIQAPVEIPALVAVAQVGETKYETFAEAVAARTSKDDVITLIKAAGTYTGDADEFPLTAHMLYLLLQLTALLLTLLQKPQSSTPLSPALYLISPISITLTWAAAVLISF